VKRSLLRSRAGFTLVEVLIASAVLGAALVVMFGFHSQAVRSNMNARRETDCTNLAQTQMERLLGASWTSLSRPTDLTEGYLGTSDMWSPLMWEDPSAPVTSGNNTDTAFGPRMYSLSWEVEDLDSDHSWARLRVRCTYYDAAFSTYHGTTISSYRFRDN
jgi:prepilin-type N-terminal cleavage/methylation domain-containing protein